jgi:3-oxoacyl-[acyl-carrier-protein] synthase II
VREPARVVVTGVGVVSALGPLPAFWEGLRRGRSGIAPIDAFDPGPAPPRTAARARDLDARAHIGATTLRRMDRLSQMVVTACRTALADAGLALDPAEAEEAGVVAGTAFGNLAESEDLVRRLAAKGPGLVNPLTFPNLVLNAPAGYAAIELGLRGPNLTVTRGEASGEAALAAAYDAIVSGQAELLLAGGGDELAPVLFHVYKDLGVLSPGAPAGRRRPRGTREERASPFDRGRNGLVMGEGAAMLVLERAERAARRGARVYAELAGYAVETVAASPHDWPEPAAATAGETARQLEDLGWDPARDAHLVVSCANSTVHLDAFEAARLARLLGEASGHALVTSVKGAVGDFGAAGALGAAAAALALGTGDLPRLGALREPLECPLRFATPETPAPGGFASALVSAAPRGGGCLTLLLKGA